MIYRLFFIIVLLIMMVFPSLAQDDENQLLQVTFEGVSLEYKTAVADNVAITRYAGDPVEGAGPGFSDAKHFTFNLYDNPYPELVGEAFPARIRVYRMDDLMQYDFMAEKVGELQTLLDEQPDLAQFYEYYMPLPYLPILTHGQFVRARADYFSNDLVRGITYVTAVPLAAAEPLLSNSFQYTFQGISTDGQYYISADFALTVDIFPAEFPQDFDIEAFSENLDQYLIDSVALLNSADASAFMPRLEMLNSVIESMTFAD